MRKIAMIYASVHHKNTEKVVSYLASHFPMEMDVTDVTKDALPDLAGAEWVIFASGIYFNTVHKAITNAINHSDLRGKKAIVLYTCGLSVRNYARAAGKLLRERGADYIGSCHCRGYDTFGPFGKIGGIAKGHPNDADMEKVLTALQQLTRR